jgi:hypothetical protein
MKRSEQLLNQALQQTGSVIELAYEIRKPRSTVESWFKRNSAISYDDGMLIEAAIKRLKRRLAAQSRYRKSLEQK